MPRRLSVSVEAALGWGFTGIPPVLAKYVSGAAPGALEQRHGRGRDLGPRRVAEPVAEVLPGGRHEDDLQRDVARCQGGRWLLAAQPASPCTRRASTGSATRGHAVRRLLGDEQRARVGRVGQHPGGLAEPSRPGGHPVRSGGRSGGPRRRRCRRSRPTRPAAHWPPTGAATSPHRPGRRDGQSRTARSRSPSPPRRRKLTQRRRVRVGDREHAALGVDGEARGLQTRRPRHWVPASTPRPAIGSSHQSWWRGPVPVQLQRRAARPAERAQAARRQLPSLDMGMINAHSQVLKPDRASTSRTSNPATGTYSSPPASAIARTSNPASPNRAAHIDVVSSFGPLRSRSPTGATRVCTSFSSFYGRMRCAQEGTAPNGSLH